ncbi:hypothetical protein EJB05_39093, partial [Eragrostis curvula]
MERSRSSSSSSSAALLLFLVVSLGASHHPAVAASASQSQRGDGAALTIVSLRGKDPGVAASLAVLTHDLSLAGFSNRTGHWHAFPGHEHVFPGGAATTLPFGGDSYRDLIGGLANLPGLSLGRAAAEESTRALSAHDDPSSTADSAALGRALTTLKVMTCEALRLRPVKETVSRAWDSGDLAARVAREHLPLIEHYDAICYEVLRARRSGQWDGPFTELLRERAGINGEEDALAVVDVLRDPTMEEVLMAHARSA